MFAQIGLGVAVLLLTARTALAGLITTPVPEPASLGLLAVGAGALLVMRARKK